MPGLHMHDCEQKDLQINSINVPVLILLLFLSIFLHGCATVDVNPRLDNINLEEVNPIPNYALFIIIDNDFQEYVIENKPTEGFIGSARTNRIHLGKPLTDTVKKQISLLVPDAKFGRNIGNDKYDVVADLNIKDVEYGYIDSDNAFKKGIGLGLIGAAFTGGDKIITHMKITIAVSLNFPDGKQKNMDIAGEGIESVGAWDFSLELKTLEKAAGRSIYDFAKNFTLLVEHEIVDNDGTKSKASLSAPSTTPIPNNNELTSNGEEKLRKLKTLYEEGLITKEEYEQERKEVLGSM